MNPKKLISFIKTGESERLEFKLKSNHPVRILNELVAFANTKGGHLIIGVDDNKNIIGLKDGDEDIFYLEQLIDERIYPKLPYKMYKHGISKDMEIVIIEIAEGNEKPYYVNEKEKKTGSAYIRIKDESIKAGKILRMLLNKNFKEDNISISYENDIQPVLRLFANKNELSREEIKESLKLKNRELDLILLKMIRNDLISFKIEDQSLFYVNDPNKKADFGPLNFLFQ